jgi:hypothetical protein
VRIPRFLYKIIISLLCIYSLWHYSCNTICFYENIDGIDEFTISEQITEDDMYIRFNYLEQRESIPWGNFETYLHYFNIAKKENFRPIDVIFDIYDLNNKIIQPIDERIDIENGEVHKRYKYSIFPPKKVRVKILLNFYYNDNYYEYSHDAIITKNGILTGGPLSRVYDWEGFRGPVTFFVQMAKSGSEQSSFFAKKKKKNNRGL